MNRIIVLLKWMAYFVGRVTPNFVSGFLRRLGSAFITPIHFSYDTGHFLSSWKKESFAKGGRVIPWYSYPLVDFLKTLDFIDKTVLEIGGGNSSFWWADRVYRIDSLESNKEWFHYLDKKNEFDNLDIHFIDDKDLLHSIEDTLSKLPQHKFDIVILDGMDRHLLVSECIKLLKDDGLFIVDDSDRYNFSITLREANFYKMDFHGYSSGVVFPKCSSIYFRTKSELFQC